MTIHINTIIGGIGAIVALLLIVIFIFRYSDFIYGYRNGLRTIKQLGKDLWAQRHADANVADQMTAFTDEVVNLSVSNKLSFYDKKVAKLNENLEELKNSKESCEKEIMSLSSSFESSILKMDHNFDDLENIDIENDINSIKSTFENEYIIKKNALEKHSTALNEEIEKCNSEIRTTKKSIEDLSVLNNRTIESLRLKFTEKLKKLKSTTIVIVLFLVEFAVTFFNFNEIFQVDAMKSRVWEIAPYLAGLFFPILFIGIFGLILRLHNKKGVLKRALYYLVLALNGISFVVGTVLFVIVQIGDNVDLYTNIMWRLYLFPVVLLTAWLLSKEEKKNASEDAFSQYDFIFVIPELLIYGTLLAILFVYNLFSFAIKSFSLRIRLWTNKSEATSLNNQKKAGEAELEQFRTQYIDNLAKVFGQEEPHEILLQKIDNLKKELLKNLEELVNTASETFNHLTKEIDEKVKTISTTINKYKKRKHNMIDGVHLATKGFKIQKQ